MEEEEWMGCRLRSPHHVLEGSILILDNLDLRKEDGSMYLQKLRVSNREH